MSTTKFLICLLTAFAFSSAALFLSSCATTRPTQDHTQNQKPQNQYQVVQYHSDWIGIDLPYKPFSALRQQIENLDPKLQQQPLKTRGEADITVINPLEFSLLTKNISDFELMSEFKNILQKDLEAAQWSPICIGEGKSNGLDKDTNSKGNNTDHMKTYYLVVSSPDLFSIREKIKNILISKGLPNTFNPQNYYPHVTLGFTHRDLHPEDGVIKDSKSCIYPIQEMKW